MFYANRGMFLETIINYTIEIINNEKQALIFKQNPSILYQNNKIFKEKSNVDYHGVYHGKYFCFEAKSTKSLTLPWNNFKKHQLEYLENAFYLNAISFVIIYFSEHNAFFLVFWEKLKFLKVQKKALTYKKVEQNGYKLEIIYPFYLDFLKFLI
ncbi:MULTISPECIES: Holliday junction resolvase RecU [unclassified Spiroplasma]|uniref:Holliday junction resolvase RecU n=1 Tax=unclassified Spiroplasma TaxID=2637901 RepID=UPI001D647230|nr:Holliday junction resolvase RecU [Spiroplasma endosymbiont of Lariophagus distinguendus]MBP1525659.1 Holliday junction resolvase RecU [Spiroplasma ixodetis]MBP1527127.1 Holliday junction resolvase RecU [Spiroplasma ixodetis]MBP1528293.1 Holliday junction resolvase RecU [Spiroplasma ixodetis]